MSQESPTQVKSDIVQYRLGKKKQNNNHPDSQEMSKRQADFFSRNYKVQK